MKKFSASVLLASMAAILLTGCAGIMPVTGGGAAASIFTQVDAATQNGAPVGQTLSCAKVGTAESTAIVFFATGDSSIKKAMENGGITKIHHVDCKVMYVLGLYAKYTTVVYGE